MKINAYAKINIFLHVTGCTEDGYHTIESMMHALRLHDEVLLNWKKIPGKNGSVNIRLNPGKPYLPSNEKNLAYKAALMMHDRFHSSYNDLIDIKITKNIPVAAGLAGGSADAAAVVNALGKLWNVSFEELLSLCAQIGSDVPFCLAAQRGKTCALCSGKGQDMEFKDAQKGVVLLYKPPFSVSTKTVYDEWQPQDCGCCENDLMPAALRLFPEIADAYERMRSAEGARICCMSGSGPTIFALFDNKPSFDRDRFTDGKLILTELLNSDKDSGHFPSSGGAPQLHP